MPNIYFVSPGYHADIKAEFHFIETFFFMFYPTEHVHESSEVTSLTSKEIRIQL